MNANADLDLDPKIQMGILILKDMIIYKKDMRINDSHQSQDEKVWFSLILLTMASSLVSLGIYRNYDTILFIISIVVDYI